MSSQYYLKIIINYVMLYIIINYKIYYVYMLQKLKIMLTKTQFYSGWYPFQIFFD